MNRRAIVAVALLAGVVGLSVAPAAAAARTSTGTATTTTDTAASTPPGGVCEALDPDVLTVTATTALGDGPSTGDTAFHGGTTLTVVLCNADGEAVETGGGDVWGLAGTEAFATATSANRSYVVRLARTNAEVALRELVERRAPEAGPTVRVTTGAVHDSALPGVDRVTFEDGTTMRGYAATESAFLSAAAAVEENASALERTARAVNESGLRNDTDRTLRALNGSRDRLSRESDEAMLSLHRSAAPDPNTTEALVRVEAIRRNTSATAEGALGSYLAALDRNVGRHRASIRRTVLSAMIPGVVVGGLLGAVLPYRRGNEVADFYQQRSGGTSDYDLTVLRWPLLAALAVLAVGVALLFVTGGYEGFIP